MRLILANTGRSLTISGFLSSEPIDTLVKYITSIIIQDSIPNTLHRTSVSNSVDASELIVILSTGQSLDIARTQNMSFEQMGVKVTEVWNAYDRNVFVGCGCLCVSSSAEEK